MMTDKLWLQVIYSYLRHQIDPQPSIPLDYLETLHVEDLDAITPDIFKLTKYTKEDVENMLESLSLIIHKMEDKQLKVSINKEPSFTEIWYEGFVELNDEQHKFWLIHPQGVDSNGNEYEVDVRWFFQRVPREIRAMVPYIIDAFKQKAHDNT